MLVVEVDEHQHAGRPCECEQTRKVNVSQSIGMPTIFLRYNPNPDKYKVKRGHQMVSTGRRLAHLVEWARHLQKEKPTAFLQVMYLYFDHFERGNEKLETILAHHV